jgi:peptide/nickel transport system substrate-binding protein
MTARSRWRAAGGAVLVGAAACAGGCDGPGRDPHGAPAVARERPVRTVLTQDPPSLSLLGKTDRNTEILAAQITDSLVDYDDHMNLVPRVAASWEQADEGRTLIFRLRPGIRWHDGRPVTAEDVVHSVTLVRDPAVENRNYPSQFRDLASVDAPDSGTVVARYHAASPDALEAWRLPLVPRHLAEPGAELLTGRFARHPVGCGPFRFVSYLAGQEVVLEANADYWDGRPRIDRLVFRIFPDERTSYHALLAGDLDLLTVTPDLWREALASEARSRLEGFVYYRLQLWLVTWNMDGSNPFFTDPRVRRALALALDRERFIAGVVYGLARRAVTSYHPDLPWTDPSLRPLEFDPDQARRLLDEAGWRDRDGDGVRDREGRPFRFTLTIHTATQRINDLIASWLQQAWAEIGVRAEIEQVEWQQFRARRDAHRFEAAMAGVGFTPIPDQYELYHSSARSGGMNWGGLADPEVDRLLERGRTTLDPVERRQIYHLLQRRLFELQPMAFLIHFPTPVLHDRRLRGIEPSPLDHWRTSRGPRVWYWSDDPTGG